MKLTYPEPRTFAVHGLDTIPDAIRALTAVVNEKPENQQGMSATGAQYVSGDGSDMWPYTSYDLIGKVLLAAGVPPQWFKGQCSVLTEADDPSDPQALDRNKRGIHVIGDELGLTPGVCAVLAEAQMAVDTGSTWAYGLTCARAMARQLTRAARARRFHERRKALVLRRFAFLR